ncbi:MAG: sensor histidine kinase [Chloroflexi bacterium]|nr:sensor histidine kinase [Chloroflexota bacterium]
MTAFTRLSLTRQFMLASFIILFSGMFIIGAWMARQIETGVVNRTGAVTALYVDSFIAPHLQILRDADHLDAENIAFLESLLMNTPLGQEIVAFKVWGPDGRILYSTNSALIGRVFPIRDQFQLAFAGEIHTEISELDATENEYENGIWSQLIETYAPVRLQGTNEIIAISEFYQKTDKLDEAVWAAQFGGWLIVGAATLTMYFLLAGLVERASNTILAQQKELQEKVTQLTGLLTQNELLHNRVTRAASRTTALNERFLLRIASDMHDGPGQNLSFALLRIEELAEACSACKVIGIRKGKANNDFNTIQASLRSAMAEMRSVLSGLRLPDIAPLSLRETVERAVRNYEQKTGHAVNLMIHYDSAKAPLSVKITLYRILQESLANGFKHAPEASQQVKITGAEDYLLAEISDDGPGFIQSASFAEGHFGLVGMRERIEILGGIFELKSSPNHGTLIRAQLPMNLLEADDV